MKHFFISCSVVISLNIVSASGQAQDLSAQQLFEPLVAVSCQDFSKIKAGFQTIATSFDSAFSGCKSGASYGYIPKNQMEDIFQAYRNEEKKVGGNGVVGQINQIKSLFLQSSTTYYNKVASYGLKYPENLNNIRTQQPDMRALNFYWSLYPLNTIENQRKLLEADLNLNQIRFNSTASIVITCLDVAEYLNKKVSSIGVLLNAMYSGCFADPRKLIVFKASEFSSKFGEIQSSSPDKSIPFDAQDVIKFVANRSAANIEYLGTIYSKIDANNAREAADRKAIEVEKERARLAIEQDAIREKEYQRIKAEKVAKLAEEQAARVRQEEVQREKSKQKAADEERRRQDEQRKWNALTPQEKQVHIDRQNAVQEDWARKSCEALERSIKAIYDRNIQFGLNHSAGGLSAEWERLNCIRFTR